MQNTLASTTALTTEWAVPWRPHALLKLQFDIEEATREYRQMQYFPPVPRVPDIDFRSWTTYQSTAYALELYGIPPNQPAQAWADWISKTEQYLLNLLQENPWAPQGRGSNLQAVHKPLVAQAAKHNWKKGKPAFWDQLKARFHLAIQQPAAMKKGPVHGFMQMIRDVHQHWAGPPTWAQFLDTCHHWRQYRDPHAAELIQQTLRHQLQETQQMAQEEATLQYKQWLQEGYNKGLRRLFRGLKTSELAWERPYRQIPMQHRMEHRLQDWGRLWHIRQDNNPQPRTSLSQEAKAQAQQLPPLTAGKLNHILKALPDKASGPDAVSTQLLRSIPPLALSPLLKLFQTMEEEAELPTQLRRHLVVMLPKNSKIITLTSVLWRVWCRLRQRTLPADMDHDRARPGACVLHAAETRGAQSAPQEWGHSPRGHVDVL